MFETWGLSSWGERFDMNRYKNLSLRRQCRRIQVSWYWVIDRLSRYRVTMIPVMGTFIRLLRVFWRWNRQDKVLTQMTSGKWVLQVCYFVAWLMHCKISVFSFFLMDVYVSTRAPHTHISHYNYELFVYDRRLSDSYFLFSCMSPFASLRPQHRPQHRELSY